MRPSDRASGVMSGKSAITLDDWGYALDTSERSYKETRRGFVPDGLERRFREKLIDWDRLQDKNAINSETNIKDKRFRRVILIERLPGNRRTWKGAFLWRLRMVCFIFGIKKLNLECKIVACQQESCAGVDERILDITKRALHGSAWIGCSRTESWFVSLE